MNREEKVLVVRAQEGDEAAFEILMKAALPKVLGLARKMLRDDEEAWDVAQEAFVRSWRKIAEFRVASTFSTWVCGITARLAIDRMRARKVIELPSAIESEGIGPEEMTERNSLAAALLAEVALLPAEERAVLELHEFGELKYREIATELKIPIGTVMSRLHSARKRLKEKLMNWSVR